jgi:hypothetical protein
MLWNRLQPQSPIPDIVVFLVCITAFGIGHIIKNVALRRNLQRVIINHGIPLDKENIKHLGFSYIISATAKNGSKHFSFNHVYGEVLEMSLIRSADMKEGCLTLFDPQSKFREPLENTLRDNGYHVPARTGKFHETETIEATGTGGENEKAEGRPRS